LAYTLVCGLKGQGLNLAVACITSLQVFVQMSVLGLGIFFTPEIMYHVFLIYVAYEFVLNQDSK
jgi:hypothetical protein